MCIQIIRRTLVIALVCALPIPAFAQTHGGLQVRTLTNQIVTLQTHAKPKDQDKDSLKNGAIIGAIVMAAWCLTVCGQGLDSAGQLPLAVAAGAGMGALIGAGIDSGFSRGHRVTFRWRF